MQIPSKEALIKVLAVVCLFIITLTFLSWSNSCPSNQGNSFQFWAGPTFPKRNDTSSDDPLVGTPEHPEERLIVHYIWFQRDILKPTGVLFLDCISVLSVMENLKPDAIFVHTDLPSFWPFDACSQLITDWTGVELVPAKKNLEIGGKKIHYVEHEADIMKLQLLWHYGGLALDFDVYLINGTKFREVYHAHPCVLTYDGNDRINNGFVACQKGAVYPGMILQESYVADYRPNEWVYNIGVRTFQLFHQHKETGYIQEGISDRPTYDGRYEFLTGPGRKHEWRDKIAHHSFLHDKGYNLDSVKRDDSSMGDMLRWIVNGGMGLNTNSSMDIASTVAGVIDRV
ncbi:hypothetical protein BV898_15262 [Hypsibius exemplaris]|uniref:Uncharacterized protein n=1 Tax=Hypsibius exemplaris TaxID=2072580 RepID=A0A9X6NHH3_HYPEX|nr:hypothetical protein BV898_15262 [Hypsibius exemplaris]